MAFIKVENAWVEFPVTLSDHGRIGASRTGGTIDVARGVVTALRDISFELHDGDRLGLMGHNGAGKSTLLRLLAGVYAPGKGRVIWSGTLSTLFSTTPGVNRDGTGRENILNCGLHLGMSRQQILAKMDEIVDFAELGDFVDLPVRIYSAGMMTRLGFSIATAVDPEILLLDEGLGTGDAHFTQKAQEKMNGLMARSSILVIASHSATFLTKMCSRSILLEHGSMVGEGPTKSLFEGYQRSVLEAAQSENVEAQRRAYALASDMVARGEKPQLGLEEQALRYALTLRPDDPAMLQRYVQVLTEQKKPVPLQTEISMLLAVLTQNPSRSGMADRLTYLAANSAGQLPADMRERAEAMLRDLKALAD